MYQRFRLAGSEGDGRHPYVNERGAFIAHGVALVEAEPEAIGRARFRARPLAQLHALLAKAYDVRTDCARLEGHLRAVAKALNDGDIARAAIALLHARLPPLPDEAAAARLAKADRELRTRMAKWREERVAVADASGLGKYSPDQPRGYHGRWVSANAETGPEQYSPDAPRIKHPTHAEREAARIKFDRGVGDLAGVTDSERFAYKEIFAAEGDILTDGRSGASSGITRTTLGAARDHVPELAGAKDPKDLTIEERAAFYRWYFDDALNGVGGHGALDEIGDKYTAAAVADTLFRHGSDAGSRAIQEAVNDVIDKLPEEKRRELGLDHVDVDGVVGSGTFSALQTIVANGYGAEFRHALSLRRFGPAVQDKVNEAKREKGRAPTPEEVRHGDFSPDRGDIERFRHFRFADNP